MGLFDFMGDSSQPGIAGGLLGGGNWSAEPGQNDAIRKALLTTGLSLLSARGGQNFGQSLGQAGLQGLDAYGGALQQNRQNQMQDFQFQQMKDQAARQKQMQALPGQFMQQPTLPATMDNRDVGQAGEQQLTPTLNRTAYGHALEVLDPMAGLQYQAATRKEVPQPIKLGDGDVLLDPSTYKPVASNPKPVADNTPTELRTLKQVYGEGSPQYIKAAAALVQQMTTHSPPVKIENYGSPVPIMNADGTVGYAQPSNKGGAAVPMIGPDGKPMVKPQEPKAMPVEFNKSVTGLKELTNGLQSYEATLKEKGGANPLAMGEKRAALQGAYTSLQMGLKNAFELGALAGPDLGLLQGMLVDPTSPRAMMLGDKGLAAQIESAREYIRNRGRAVYDAHKQPVPPEYASKTAPTNMNGLSPAEQAELAQLRKMFPKGP